jgi:hypothetical protein
LEDDEHDADPEERQHDVVRERRQPLDVRQPAVELALRIRLGDLEPHRPWRVGRGITVIEQRQMGEDPAM